MNYIVSMAAARVNAGLTQEEIAEKMQISRQTVANWESGRVSPRPAQFKLFCELCNAPMDKVSLYPRFN